MAKSSTYWDKRALRRLSEAEKLSDEHIESIKRIYEQAYRDVSKEIERTYKAYSKNTGVDVEKLKELLTKKETDKVWKTLKRQGLDKYIKDNYKARISRLEKIQAQIYAKAKMIYPKEELQNTMAYKGVINQSYYKAVYDAQMGTGYDFSFSKIDDNMINAVLTEKWSGKNYSQRIWKNTDYLAESLSYTIGGALLSGQSIEKTTRQIRERFNVSKYYAERLVRTETNHFNNLADAMAYEELGVEEYVFVATLDNRTSDICQSHDNKRYKYADKEEGVNYPPLHPNCRSTTRGFVSEEAEKTLKRRARNPYTGKTEIIDNMSYSEWAKKHGLATKPVTSKPKNNVTKPVEVRNNVVIDVNDLPTQLTSSKKELTNSKNLVDYINNQKNADPKVVEVYKSMGKLTNMDFKVSHAKDSSIRWSRSRSTGVISDFKLTIPNVDSVDDIGHINVVLHENMHFVDFMAGNKYSSLHISLEQPSLKDALRGSSAEIPKDIKDLFDKYNLGCKDIRDKVTDKFKPLFEELNNKPRNGVLDYVQYNKEWNKLKRAKELEIDTLERNYMGGGINNLQDIYDALSGGKYRDNGTVRYGHGSRYYSTFSSRVTEIVANYGALSITRPDLIDLLKADNPALVSELDKLMDTILKGGK